MGEAVTIPYFSHAYARRQSRGRGAPRRGVMFHGGLHRFDHGVRDRMVAIMQRLNGTRTPVNLRVGEFTRSSAARNASTAPSRRAAYQVSGGAYSNASICLAPSGDVLSSRRLFDALAAACVPVLLRSRWLLEQRKQTFYASLPFPRSIDWQNATLRLVPSPNRNCVGPDADWIGAWHESAAPLEALRRRGAAAFRRHLDYERNPAGVVSALLAEVAARLGSHCALDAPAASSGWPRIKKSAARVGASVSHVSRRPSGRNRAQGAAASSPSASRLLGKTLRSLDSETTPVTV